MFYEIGSAWANNENHTKAQARDGKTGGGESTDLLQQSEWLGWDGWVIPEPQLTTAQDPKTAT